MRILRINRVVSDPGRAEAFYRDALGFHTAAPGEPTIMRLGEEEIALVRAAPAATPMPADSRSDDLWFQHLAIVVSDMDAAYAHLSAHAGLRAISQGGPQTLPPENGSVRAFKFRDPDGHPLELLWLPPDQGRGIWQQRRSAAPFLGIDHSALAVADTDRSVAFYQALGFSVSARSLNQGPAQARLDGLEGATVQVTGLRPASPNGPGLELLAYQPPGRAAEVSQGDIAADWVTVAGGAMAGPRAMQDPDGHRLMLEREATA